LVADFNSLNQCLRYAREKTLMALRYQIQAF
jgi:hypothetical protein